MNLSFALLTALFYTVAQSYAAPKGGGRGSSSSSDGSSFEDNLSDEDETAAHVDQMAIAYSGKFRHQLLCPLFLSLHTLLAANSEQRANVLPTFVID